MDYPWDKEIQICANEHDEAPGVKNSPTPEDIVLYSQKFKKCSSHETTGQNVF